MIWNNYKLREKKEMRTKMTMWLNIGPINISIIVPKGINIKRITRTITQARREL